MKINIDLENQQELNNFLIEICKHHNSYHIFLQFIRRNYEPDWIYDIHDLQRCIDKYKD